MKLSLQVPIVGSFANFVDQVYLLTTLPSVHLGPRSCDPLISSRRQSVGSVISGHRQYQIATKSLSKMLPRNVGVLKFRSMGLLVCMLDVYLWYSSIHDGRCTAALSSMLSASRTPRKMVKNLSRLSQADIELMLGLPTTSADVRSRLQRLTR